MPGEGLPGWCDRFLDPPGGADFFASRAWYDAVLAHALPTGAAPLLALCGGGGGEGDPAAAAAVLPLLRLDGRLRSLATPYTLAWRPLVAPGADAAALRAAGQGLGCLLRLGPPALLDTLDAEAPGLDALQDGLRAAGLRLDRYRHFGNWHEALAPCQGWDAYLAARPPALRTTITRKVARCSREMRFELVAAPGEALDDGIAAYEAVRARSWKPFEPFPAFDAVLMRVAAALGALRLGVFRARVDGRPVAAQYWIVGGGRAWLLKLAHAEDQRAASPGTALTALMIRHLLEEDGVRELDFGRGDDAYKQLWVTRRRQRVGLLVADPRHPAGLLALARQAAGRGRRRVLGWLAGRGETGPGAGGEGNARQGRRAADPRGIATPPPCGTAPSRDGVGR